jgi:hypothetical protein
MSEHPEIVRMARAVREHEPAYLRAIERVKSPEITALVNEVLEDVSQFTPGDSGEKAIAVLAVAARLARMARAPQAVIDTHKRLERTLAEMREREAAMRPTSGNADGTS